MEIIHIAAECYPVAKAGGLGDVVGALPKYQARQGHVTKVLMPMYRTKFLYQNDWELVHEGGQHIGSHWFHYSVIREKSNKLGFDLYLLDINNLLDREKIYGYDDDAYRFAAFQIAACDWINQWQHQPDIIHCHDHHTGLIPFMVKYCFEFRNKMADIPTIFTVHNGQYQGWMNWNQYYYLPAYDSWNWGMLEWEGVINPLASAVKCAWKVTTVSHSYMEELRHNANGLEDLFEYERGKCSGILNGIDTEVWDPETDEYLSENYNAETVNEGKEVNKKKLCEQFGLDPAKPLFSFIGRLVGEKAADLLPEAISNSIYAYNGQANFIILGSGEPEIENQFKDLSSQFPMFINSYIGYSEPLSHQIYASSDFLLMPSRVEPCGLNQMYALRYGTVPVVRNVGGLRDTVTDFGDWQGFGVRFDQASVGDIVYSIGRSLDLYQHRQVLMDWIKNHIMGIDHSWDSSAQQYIDLYEQAREAVNK